MADRNLLRSSASSQLLRKLIDHPQLPSLVPKLKTTTLTKLIESIGVEDSGPIVAHTTARQLQRIFDEVLWQSLVPGGAERMSAEEFIRWLEVMNEQGDYFVAERLEVLGLQFAVAQFSLVIEVFEIDDTHTFVDAAVENFGRYAVLAKFPEEWDVVRTALAAIDTDYPDFLSSVLGNVGTVMKFTGVERTSIAAVADESHDRDQRRESDGYVTKYGAQEFLNYARTQALDELVTMSEYDRTSRRYLAAAEVDESADQNDAIDESGIKELSAILAAVEVIPRAMRLAGPARQLPIKELLDQLEQDSPDRFDLRLQELVLLGNILVSGTTDRGKRFSEVEAANAALSISNLGAGYLISQQGIDLDTILGAEPGLVRAFSVGWNILHRVPPRAARHLVATLRGEEVRQRLQTREWILREVDVAIADFVNRVDLGKFNEIDDTLSFISLVVEAETCERLKILISEFPRLPEEALPGDRVAVSSRHLDNIEDLRLIDEFLNGLDKHIKL